MEHRLPVQLGTVMAAIITALGEMAPDLYMLDDIETLVMSASGGTYQSQEWVNVYQGRTLWTTFECLD